MPSSVCLHPNKCPRYISLALKFEMQNNEYDRESILPFYSGFDSLPACDSRLIRGFTTNIQTNKNTLSQFHSISDIYRGCLQYGHHFVPLKDSEPLQITNICTKADQPTIDKAAGLRIIRLMSEKVFHISPINMSSISFYFVLFKATYK